MSWAFLFGGTLFAAVRHDPIYVEAYYFVGIVAATTGVGVAFAAAYRRHDKAKAHKIESLERERARQLQDLADRVQKVTDAILGQPSTLERPFPEPGLLEQVVALREDVAEVKKEVTPNGLDSNRLGDRVARLKRDWVAYHNRDEANAGS